MSTWRTTTTMALGKPVQRTGVHAMTERVLHWRYCANCGILGLKNDTTRRALRKPCVWEE